MALFLGKSQRRNLLWNLSLTRFMNDVESVRQEVSYSIFDAADRCRTRAALHGRRLARSVHLTQDVLP